MDFTKTLRNTAGLLDSHGVRYAVIGGLALSVYGGTRTTRHLDLAADGDAQPEVIRIMDGLGFELLQRSTGFSNHWHQRRQWGRVDYMYLRGESRDRIFEALKVYPGPGGLELPVPKPEDLAAMKVVAMKNDPSRRVQDLEDIRVLLRWPKTDRQEVSRFFAKQGLEERYAELEATL